MVVELIGTERVVVFAEGALSDFPSIALPDYNQRNVARVASTNITDIAHMRFTPSSGRTYPVAGHGYPIDRNDMVVGMPTLEIMCIIFSMACRP